MRGKPLRDHVNLLDQDSFLTCASFGTPCSNSDQQRMAKEWSARLKEQVDKHVDESARLQESIKQGVRMIGFF